MGLPGEHGIFMQSSAGFVSSLPGEAGRPPVPESFLPTFLLSSLGGVSPSTEEGSFVALLLALGDGLRLVMELESDSVSAKTSNDGGSAGVSVLALELKGSSGLADGAMVTSSGSSSQGPSQTVVSSTCTS